MISKQELQLIVVGTATEAARQILKVNGRRLTSTELDAMGEVIHTAMQLLADRLRPPAIPALPVQQVPRERRPAMFFQPLLTQELPRVSDEDIAKARQK